MRGGGGGWVGEEKEMTGQHAQGKKSTGWLGSISREACVSWRRQREDQDTGKHVQRGDLGGSEMCMGAEREEQN